MIKRVIQEDGGYVEITTGDLLGLSRRNKEAFLQKMLQISRYR